MADSPVHSALRRADATWCRTTADERLAAARIGALAAAVTAAVTVVGPPPGEALRIEIQRLADQAGRDKTETTRQLADARRATQVARDRADDLRVDLATSRALAGQLIAAVLDEIDPTMPLATQIHDAVEHIHLVRAYLQDKQAVSCSCRSPRTDPAQLDPNSTPEVA